MAACVESHNLIDGLHDDILVRILSLLTLKEAGQTSVLSKRWRYIWAYVTTLNFVNINFLNEIHNRDLSVDEEEPKYFNWVDRVMSLHKAPIIDEFTIQFNLQANRKDNVESWVRSAMERRVKRFRLDIAPVPYKWENDRLYYTFPSLSFSDSLTSLQLNEVHVTGQVLEKLLHDCPLEYLSVTSSQFVENLKVVGPSLKLKTLRLICCYVKSLEISAPNLTSLDYVGGKLNFPFKSIPKLTQVYIGGLYAEHLLYDNFSSLSSYTSQIEVLILEPLSLITKPMLQVFPVFTRLKMLHVTFCPESDAQLFDLRSLIKACPLLHTFVFRLGASGDEVKRTASMRNVEACPHHCLKIVEIIQFVGWEADFGFAKYLIENAVSLEKIIIEPVSFHTRRENCAEKRKTRARLRAEQLRSILNPGSVLEIRDAPELMDWSLY